jgi:hypothetical protein
LTEKTPSAGLEDEYGYEDKSAKPDFDSTSVQKQIVEESIKKMNLNFEALANKIGAGDVGFRRQASNSTGYVPGNNGAAANMPLAVDGN